MWETRTFNYIIPANSAYHIDILENVEIINSTVIGHRNVGALVGNASDDGKVELKGAITLDNVQVKTVGGRSGLLIGYLKEANLTNTATIATKNGCSYSIYECEQNTGTFEGQKLGFDSATNILYSYAYNNSAKKDKLEDKKFFEGAYATLKDDSADGSQVKYEGFTVTEN